MLIGISVITTCLLFSIMVLILFFSKKRINTMENKIYTILIIITVVGLILELLCCYFTFRNGQSTLDTFLCILCNRFFILYMLTWLFVFTFYIFYVTFYSDKKRRHKLDSNKNKIIMFSLIIYAIVFLLTMILPLYYHTDGIYVYSYGPATNLLVFVGAITIMFDIYCVFQNRKNILKRQYFPLFVLIVLMIIVLIIRNINPGIILINSTFAFITILMYHTIENPDLKIIEELNKNKLLIEKNSQGISNFMFVLTAEAKRYTKDITNICENSLNEKNISYQNALKEIIEKTKEIEMKVNNLIDVSAIDIKNIKIMNKVYNIQNILNEIEIKTREKINKNIEFLININPNIPEGLYGDKIRIKQIISSLLENAIKNTEKGFISLDVNTIIKYDICRLIISIEDSGKGIDLEKVNEILSSNDDVNEDELSKINTLNMNLKLIKKVMKMLGGSFLLTSEEGKGTKVTIVLDQKIADNINQEFEKKLADYSQKLGVQKVLIVDDDLNELNNIQSLFDNFGIITVGTMYGQDCLDRYRVGQKYDLVILDDSMNSMNAINILKDLKNNNDFNTPVIVMLDENKLSISRHYLNDGFIDYMDKSKLDVEVKRVVNKYLD